MSDRLEKNCGVLLAFSSRQGMATIFRSSGQLTVKKLTVFRGLQPKSGDCVTEFCSGRSGCGLGSDICPKNLGNDVGVLARVTSQLSLLNYHRMPVLVVYTTVRYLSAGGHYCTMQCILLAGSHLETLGTHFFIHSSAARVPVL